MREKLDLDNERTREIGITPACAGKTMITSPNGTKFRDHPRVCGKNSSFVQAYNMDLGSPPRVREKQLNNRIDYIDTGITPACAGKTTTQSMSLNIS